MSKKKSKNNKNLFLFIILFIIIIFLFHKNIYIKKINLLISYKNLDNEFKIILSKLNNNEVKILKYYKKIISPKISIISPIFNREKYILRFLKNMQYQIFNDIEIILVDDFSLDNSIKKIKEYQKNDERIILIINKKNKGTFISRNIGVLYSNSKYVFLPDQDDIINKKIIKLCYKYMEKYNYEIIRFNMFKRNGESTINENSKFIHKSIYQPELSTYMFYGNNELQITDYYIHNKFINKECYIRALNSLNKEFFNMYITLWEDTIMSYILYREAKSFYFLKNIGYYYIKNSQSITKNMFKISELKLRFIFVFLRIVFENSKNNKYERDMANALFTELNQNLNIRYRLSTLSFNSYFNYFTNVINMYLNSPYINKENKFLLNIFNNIIETTKKNK